MPDSPVPFAPSPLVHEPEPSYYFGCWGGPGHYFWTYGMQSPAGGYHSTSSALPWDDIDGKMTPRSTRAQGAALLHRKDGWTALALHDYTGDSRPGSNSVFFLHGTFDFETALLFARAVYPEVLARVGEIHLVEEPS